MPPVERQERPSQLARRAFCVLGVDPVSAPSFYTAPVVPLAFRKVLPLLALRIYLSEGEAETWGERETQTRGGLSNQRCHWSLLSERRLHRV